MAKLQGIFGAGRGKVGNVVLSKGPKANTIARAYQPQVTNPKSALQIEQRSKMNAAGRFSRLWPKSALTALSGGSALNNRSMFNQMLLRASKYSLVGSHADVIPDLVQFSRGVEPLPSGASAQIDGDAITTTNVGIAINLTLGEVTRSGAIARIHAAFIPNAGVDLSPVANTVNIALNMGAINGDIAVRVPLNDPAIVNLLNQDEVENLGYVYVWTEYLVPTTEAARQIYQSLTNGTTSGTEVISAAVDSLQANGGSWTKTYYTGNVAITQAATPNP